MVHIDAYRADLDADLFRVVETSGNPDPFDGLHLKTWAESEPGSRATEVSTTIPSLAASLRLRLYARDDPDKRSDTGALWARTITRVDPENITPIGGPPTGPPPAPGLVAQFSGYAPGVLPRPTSLTQWQTRASVRLDTTTTTTAGDGDHPLSARAGLVVAGVLPFPVARRGWASDQATIRSTQETVTNRQNGSSDPTLCSIEGRVGADGTTSDGPPAYVGVTLDVLEGPEPSNPGHDGLNQPQAVWDRSWAAVGQVVLSAVVQWPDFTWVGEQEAPLRQRQRDDGLGSSATRTRGASSRQRSTRQRAYL